MPYGHARRERVKFYARSNSVFLFLLYEKYSKELGHYLPLSSPVQSTTIQFNPHCRLQFNPPQSSSIHIVVSSSIHIVVSSSIQFNPPQSSSIHIVVSSSIQFNPPQSSSIHIVVSSSIQFNPPRRSKPLLNTATNKLDQAYLQVFYLLPCNRNSLHGGSYY